MIGRQDDENALGSHAPFEVAISVAWLSRAGLSRSFSARLWRAMVRFSWKLGDSATSKHAP
jgi:hypothetical protein